MSEPTSSVTPSSPDQATASASPAADPNQELQALRSLVIRLQSGLIVLTWIVGVFIFIQFWRARNELNVVRPQAAPIIEAAKRTDPAINQFISQLVEYARTHPDIQPMLAKYPIQIQQSPTSAVPATATAPKPASPAAAPTTPPGTAPKK